MLEPKTKEPLGFTETMKILKQEDQDLFEATLHNLDFKTWKPMLERLREHDQKEYKKLTEGLTTLREKHRRPPNEAQNARVEVRRIARMIAKNYKCTTGFAEEGPVTKTVTVRMKEDRVVTGLPPEIMTRGNQLAADFGGVRKWTFGFDNRIFVTDLSEDAIEAMRGRDDVEAVVVEPMARILSNEIPTYNPAAEMTDWGVDRVNPENAWLGDLKGETIKVCVCDTGIKSAHRAFWLNGETNFKGGYNFVAGNSNPADDHDHGTYCCGIVASRHTGLAGYYRGIAPNIDLYACKVLDAKGSGSYANIAAGIDWARTHGMDIISLSLGGPSGSSVLQAACDNAWYAGLVTFAAAGNEGPEPNTIGYPGRYNSVIAVAASDYNDNIASFSSRGPELDITAPGRYIVGPWAGFTYDDYVVANSNSLYICASGTSAACPHAAASAALIKQWYKAFTNLEIRQWLIDHAIDL